MTPHTASPSPAPEFIISRVFDAPQQRVWDAWTKPELMAEWWGPKGFAVDYYALDFRPGGTYHYCMKTPTGIEMWGKFQYRDIDEPSRIVFVNSFSDAEGNITVHPMSPTWPRETLSTITFETIGDKTKVVIHWTPLDATSEQIRTFEAGMASMNQGWTGTLDQLTAFLAKS